MTLAPRWRTRLAAGVGGLVAIWIGSNIAHEAFFVPMLAVALCAALLPRAIQVLPMSALLLGAALYGYVVGNRGFAQLTLAGSFPLLPGEFVLMVTGGLLLVSSAMRRELPFRREPLNMALLLWMLVSSIRLFWDVRTYGMVALRDYAMVYYAAFFFIAQQVAANPNGFGFLHKALLWACGSLLVAYPLFLEVPGFFLDTLVVRGAPLIFLKGDLAGTFMAVGAVLFYGQFEFSRSRTALVLSLLLAGSAIATNNRASMLGLFVATLLFALAGRWRFAATQAAAGAIALAAIMLVAVAQGDSWKKTSAYGLYERVLSLADPFGHRSYIAEDAANKGDNNLFRATWWQLLVEETVAANPLTGLGFGHDLAGRFAREYYAHADEFTTRSPHSIIVTTFARTGLVGVIPFVLITGLAARLALRSSRKDPIGGSVGCAAITVLTSSLFGVVLEGPMGAVVFWSMLGMASARNGPRAPEDQLLLVDSPPSGAACPMGPADQRASPDPHRVDPAGSLTATASRCPTSAP